MFKFVATQNTLIKTFPKQSSELNSDAYIEVQAGDVLLVEDMEIVEQHYQIPVYLFKGHWEVAEVKPVPPSTHRYISDEGLRLIKRFEGLRLKSYQDTGLVWTLGYGHTKGVKPGMTITQTEAEKLLMEDLYGFEEAVTKTVKVPLNDNQYAACVSLCFNVGETAFAKSSLTRILNAGNYKDASGEFLKWIYDNGRVIPGLVKRRQAERGLFLS